LEASCQTKSNLYKKNLDLLLVLQDINMA
jgi:DNA repair photolyase